MPTFSTRLRLEQQDPGSNSDTWGTTFNIQLGLLDEAIAGVSTIAMPDANLSLTVANGLTDQSRFARLAFTGTLTAARTVTLPSLSKHYVVGNFTNQTINLNCGGGTDYALPAGAWAAVACDGSAVFSQISHLPALTVSGSLAAGAATVAGNAVWHAGNFNPSAYAPALGYTAVQQGTGIGQLANAIKLGWSAGARLKATVDSTDLGNLVTDTQLGAYLPKAGGSISGDLTVLGTAGLQGITGTTCTLNNVLTCLSPRGVTPGRAMVDSTNAFGPWGWNSTGGYVQANILGSAFGIAVFVSDIRLKADIAPASQSALGKIGRLDFIDFRYALGDGDPGAMQHGGISAQQAQEIDPCWVHVGDDERGTLSLNAPLLLTNALQAVQELSARLAATEARLAALEAA